MFPKIRADFVVVTLVTIGLLFLFFSFVTKNRTRALAAAVRDGDLESVRYMLNRGADINARDEDGDPLFRTAVRFNERDIALLLEERGAPSDPETNLLAAALLGRTEAARELLKSGVNPNAKDADGDTALAYAGPWGHVDIVKLLLQHRADVNNRNLRGQTPLMWAKECNDPQKRAEIERLLRKAGAK